MAAYAKTTESTDSALFKLLVETIRDYAIFLLSPDGHVLTWNAGAEAIKGYRREEIVGQHFSKFYPEEAVQTGWPDRELALAEKEGRFADEGWRIRKDGSKFWASVTITALRDSSGALAGFAKVTLDLTPRRQIEEHIQGLNRELSSRIQQLAESQRLVELRTQELQKLSGRLLHVQDEERRRVARDLHDDVGQQLVGIKMMLGRSNTREAIELTDAAINSVRSLSHLLHPPLLEEAGLRAALHFLVDGVSKRSGIQISLTVKPQMFPRLTDQLETTIYRLIQESLTNIYRHAESQSARVEVEALPEIVVIRVRDHGKGIKVDSDGRIASQGVGIGGMRERVRQFGGELIVARAEPGTLVEATIPMKSNY